MLQSSNCRRGVYATKRYTRAYVVFAEKRFCFCHKYSRQKKNKKTRTNAHRHSRQHYTERWYQFSEDVCTYPTIPEDISAKTRAFLREKKKKKKKKPIMVGCLTNYQSIPDEVSTPAGRLTIVCALALSVLRAPRQER